MPDLKGLLWVVVCGGFAVSLLIGCGGGGGEQLAGTAQQSGSSGTKQPKSPNAANVKKPQPPKVLDNKAKPIEDARDALDNTEWDVNITSLTEKKKNSRTDTLRFVDKKFYSVSFDSQGYHISNYSLRIKPDGMIVWETMQTKEGEGVLFWRGEWRNGKMTGVISKQPQEGESESFNFKSTGSRKIEK